ncbi:GNAT family N-acetyltransferase [Gordonia desulfuricans]|uniref:GNAT family N-acetyltransferase n=2 Tax=Gordonia desulfuricans TaxID=89051 RepID=A0A7K3LLK8_9ACTN|nr:GNAT family N-acetyltransferase [Gordonia desulfuricans]
MTVDVADGAARADSTGTRPTIAALTGADQVNTAFGVFLRSMVGLPFRGVDATAVTETGRYLGAFDGDRIVGGADSYTSDLVVPGGARVAHAAVTHVGVLPTHRRRGIVTALIERQLEDFAHRGEVVATLRASEAGIYERFGYGIASTARSLLVDTRRARLRESVVAQGSVRLADADADTELLAAVHRRTNGVGAIERPAGWWRLQELRRAADPTVHYVAVHSRDGVDEGYVIYRPRDTEAWFTSREKAIDVIDFVALTDAARFGLWRHLLDLDLVDVIHVGSAALDDPLPLALTDERAVELGAAHDETWLRLIDVEAALRARRFGDGPGVRIGVEDRRLPANTAVFEITAGAVTRSTRAAEATVDVATLAAAYLGGTTWRRLASAGRVDVHTGDAVNRLDRLFGTGTQPYSGTTF